MFVLAGTLNNCNNTSTSGTATEDGNAVAISGTVFNADNSPLAKARVFLFSETFNPALTDSFIEKVDTTDSEGHYRFDSVTAGSYRLRCDDSNAILGDYLDSAITVSPNDINPIFVTPFVVSSGLGLLNIYDTIFKGVDTFSIYITGTDVYLPKFVPNTNAGFYLPAGKYSSVILKTLYASAAITLADSFTILPAETTTIRIP